MANWLERDPVGTVTWQTVSWQRVTWKTVSWQTNHLTSSKNMVHWGKINKIPNPKWKKVKKIIPKVNSKIVLRQVKCVTSAWIDWLAKTVLKVRPRRAMTSSSQGSDSAATTSGGGSPVGTPASPAPPPLTLDSFIGKLGDPGRYQVRYLLKRVKGTVSRKLTHVCCSIHHCHCLVLGFHVRMSSTISPNCSVHWCSQYCRNCHNCLRIFFCAQLRPEKWQITWVGTVGEGGGYFYAIYSEISQGQGCI